MPMPEKVVLATGNAGKVREIQHILGGLGVQVVPQTELGVGEAEETAELAAYLASESCRHIVGQIIPLAGGCDLTTADEVVMVIH